MVECLSYKKAAVVRFHQGVPRRILLWVGKWPFKPPKRVRAPYPLPDVVTQQVECVSEKHDVAGSIPARVTSPISAADSAARFEREGQGFESSIGYQRP